MLFFPSDVLRFRKKDYRYPKSFHSRWDFRYLPIRLPHEKQWASLKENTEKNELCYSWIHVSHFNVKYSVRLWGFWTSGPMCGRTWQLITTRVKLGLCSGANAALFSAWLPLWLELGLNYFIQNEGLFRLMKSLIKTLPWNNLRPFSTRLKPPQALLVHCLLFSITILNCDDIDAPFWHFGRVRSPTCLWLVGVAAWESHRGANHVFRRRLHNGSLYVTWREAPRISDQLWVITTSAEFSFSLPSPELFFMFLDWENLLQWCKMTIFTSSSSCFLLLELSNPVGCGFLSRVPLKHTSG